MKTEKIKAIFTNLLFVIGIILVIVGFVRGTLTATQMLVFDKYPLDSYEETRCDTGIAPAAPTKEGETPAMTKTELKDQKEKCLNAVEMRRKVKKTEDIVTSITTLISGMALIYFFKRFIFK
jgi:hypothetical protein